MKEACSSTLISRQTTHAREGPTCAPGSVTALLSSPRLAGLGFLLLMMTVGQSQETTSMLACCHRNQPQLLWENVEGPPQWIQGCRPGYQSRWKMHTVSLRPGASTSIRIPAYGQLRVVHPECSLAPGAVAIWLSNGSGMARLLQPAVTEQGHSLLVASDLPHPGVVHIVRGQHHDCDLRLALFLSSRQHAQEPPPFGNAVCQGEQVSLRRTCDGHLEVYTQVRPRSWHPLSIEGGEQLVLDTRFVYQASESRRLQSYPVILRYDGQAQQVVEFETTSDVRSAWQIDHCDVVVGQRQQAFVCIPRHVQSVELSTPCHLLIRGGKCGGFCHAGNHVCQCGSVNFSATPALNDESHWQIEPAAILRRTQSSTSSLPPSWLYRIARDNSYRSGGLSAAVLAKAQAARWHEHPRWLSTASQLRTHHTGYRSLLPSRNGSPVVQQHRWFLARRPRDHRQRTSALALSHTFTEDALRKSLAAGFFVAVPSSGDAPLLYTLPQESSPSWLRVAADVRGLRTPTTLLVQFDQRAPFALRVVPEPDLAASDYEPAFGELALAGLHARHGTVDSGTLGGPFSQRGSPAELIWAGTHELLVPASIRRVAIWCSDPQAQLPVAVQYRSSNPFSLSETTYLAFSDYVAPEQASSMLQTPAVAPSATVSFAEHALRNHRQPLVRLLRRHARHLRVKVPAPQGVEDSETMVRELDRLQDLAQESGNTPLLERLLLGRALHSPHPVVQLSCYRQLLYRYRLEEKDAAREQLTAAFALDHPSEEAFTELAEALRDNGRCDEALQVALAGGDRSRLAPLIAECSYGMRWWQVFEEVLSELPASLASYWRGHRCLYQGQYAEAIRHFDNSGPVGAPFSAHVEEAISLLPELRSRDATARAKAILAWERWQGTHPGATHWVDDPTLVSASLGGALVYSSELDRTSRYYLASPDVPAALIVYGPTQLQVTVRPLHVAGATRPLDSWLNMRSRGLHHVVPINANHVNEGLSIVGDQQQRVGSATHHVLDLGAGRHELSIDTSDVSCLLQIQRAQPTTPIPILPPLNRYTFAAVAEGRLGVHANAAQPSVPQRVRMLSPGRPATLAPLVHPARSAPSDRHTFIDGLEGALRGRMLLRLGFDTNLPPDDLHREQLRDLATTRRELGPRERVDALSWGNSLAGAESLLLYGSLALPPRLGQAHCMDRHGAEAAADFQRQAPAWESDPDAMYQQAVYLLRAADDDPARRPQFQLGSYALTEIYSHQPEMAGLRERAGARLSWQPVVNVRASAGIHLEEVAGWSPESPRTRMQQEFLRNLHDRDIVLGGERGVALELRNLEPVELRIELELLDAWFRPLAPCTVTRSIDGQHHAQIQLHASKRRETQTITVEAGEHHLAWNLEAAALGQYVRLRVEERRPDGTSRIITRTVQRHYHVASEQEPIRLSFAEPTLLRINPLGGTAYFLLASDPRQEIVIRPEGQTSAYRIHQAVAATTAERRYAFQAAPAPLRVPPPLSGPLELPHETVAPAGSLAAAASDLAQLSLRAGDAPVLIVHGVDQRRLGGGEDGTWAWGGGWFHRRPADEIPFAGRADRFAELFATHRHHDEDFGIFRRTQLLARQRAAGGHSYGLKLDRWDMGREDGWRLHHFASAFLQQPEPTLAGVDAHTEWSLYFRGVLSKRFELLDRCYHLPTVGLFGRVLSLDENTYGPGQLDQDIFTQYKHDHPLGWTFSDRFVFQRCADCNWWVRPAMSTNEGLDATDLDNVRVSVGWTGIKGNLDFELAHRYAHFLADDDRRRSLDQHMLMADVRWNHWSYSGRHVEVAGRLRHDMQSGRASAGLWFTCYLDRGRRYRDFHASEFHFPAVRRVFASRDTAPLIE